MFPISSNNVKRVREEVFPYIWSSSRIPWGISKVVPKWDPVCVGVCVCVCVLSLEEGLMLKERGTNMADSLHQQ